MWLLILHLSHRTVSLWIFLLLISLHQFRGFCNWDLISVCLSRKTIRKWELVRLAIKHVEQNINLLNWLNWQFCVLVGKLNDSFSLRMRGPWVWVLPGLRVCLCCVLWSCTSNLIVRLLCIWLYEEDCYIFLNKLSKVSIGMHSLVLHKIPKTHVNIRPRKRNWLKFRAVLFNIIYYLHVWDNKCVIFVYR